MSCLLELRDVTVSVAGTTLVDAANASLVDGSVTALVGANGSGKSTLLAVLAGGAADEHHATVAAGRVAGPLAPGRRPPGSVVLVEQENLQWSRLLPGAGMDEDELRELTLPDALDMALADPDADADAAAEDAELWRRLHVAASPLLGWAAARYDETPLGRLSPGAALRAYLAVALRRPAVRLVLLDEPTNFLDLPSIVWLQHALLASGKAAVVVSHDEAFLDAVADHVWEIDIVKRSLAVSRAMYSAYKESRRRAEDEQRHAFDKQQRRHARLTATAERLKAKSKAGERKESRDHDLLQRDFKRDRAGRSGKKAAAVVRLRDAAEKVEAVVERQPLVLRLDPVAAGVDSSILANGLRAGHAGGRALALPPVSLRVDYGERVALYGPNAVGKTTLLRTITGDLEPLGGSVAVGRDLRVGNLAEEYREMPRGVSPRDYVHALVPELDRLKATSRAINAGLTRHQAESPIAELNPGCRVRLLLSALALRRVNAVVLDEPTNHLDEEATAELLAALGTYPGTVLVVSHDRSFLRGLELTAVYELSPGLGLRRVESIDAVAEGLDAAAAEVVRRSA